MIHIERVTLREILLPLAEPFRTAKGIVENRRIILLEITDSSGTTVWSECVAGAAPEYTAETVESAWNALSHSIIGAVLGKDFEHPQEMHRSLVGIAAAQPMARAAVEMGAWALLAQRQEKPLAALLADACAVHPRPRSSIQVGIVIGMSTGPGSVASGVTNALAQGYRRIKLKISPAVDIHSLRLVREIAGRTLAVDANGSFSMEDATEIQTLMEVDTLGLCMIEQPLAADRWTDHAELQKILATPICLDESLGSKPDVDRMIDLGSGRIVNLKPARVGGFTEAIAIHDRCAEQGIPLWCGGMLESGIGRAYSVALASLPSFSLPADLSPSARYWEREVVTSPWMMRSDGLLDVPLHRNGTGVDVDQNFVADITTREVTLEAD